MMISTSPCCCARDLPPARVGGTQRTCVYHEVLQIGSTQHKKIVGARFLIVATRTVRWSFSAAFERWTGKTPSETRRLS